VQHEREPLGRRQRLEDHEQREPDRVGEQRPLLGVDPCSRGCLAARRGDPVRIEGVSDPADPDRDLYETDALLPGPAATLAGPTFEEWLDATASPGGDGSRRA
jgi:hypothetical protein